MQRYQLDDEHDGAPYLIWDNDKAVKLATQFDGKAEAERAAEAMNFADHRRKAETVEAIRSMASDLDLTLIS